MKQRAAWGLLYLLLALITFCFVFVVDVWQYFTLPDAPAGGGATPVRRPAWWEKLLGGVRDRTRAPQNREKSLGATPTGTRRTHDAREGCSCPSCQPCDCAACARIQATIRGETLPAMSPAEAYEIHAANRGADWRPSGGHHSETEDDDAAGETPE